MTYKPHAEADGVSSAEYARIDAELVAQFDDDTGHQPVFSTEEIVGWPFFENESRWWPWCAKRDAYEARIDQIIERQPSPALAVRALARRGSLSYSMWRAVISLERRGFVLISPTVRSVMARDAKRDADDPVGFSAPELEEAIRGQFDRWRQYETESLAERAIAGYAWSAMIARRYGLPFSETKARLVILREQLGAKHFAELVYRAAPPPGFAPIYERLVASDLGLPP